MCTLDPQNWTEISHVSHVLLAPAGNINIHKLDAAFDIDPLFHKMSKTFDEGGAKGLLLANLNVSAKGCNIVFDSSLDQNETAEEETVMMMDDITTGSGGLSPAMQPVDISSLMAQLKASLPTGQTVHQQLQELPLVPQLASLRSEFRMLKEEGFVEDDGTSVSALKNGVGKSFLFLLLISFNRDCNFFPPVPVQAI